MNVQKPTDSESLQKEDYLLGPNVNNRLLVESRSIYIGDKEAFFNYIVDAKKDLGT